MEFLPFVPPSPAVFPESPIGSGSVVFQDTVSENGIIHTRSGTGWYKVNPDCSATKAWRESNGTQNSDFHLEMFIGKDGKAVYVANIDTAPDGSTPLFVLGTTLNRMDACPDFANNFNSNARFLDRTGQAPTSSSTP